MFISDPVYSACECIIDFQSDTYTYVNSDADCHCDCIFDSDSEITYFELNENNPSGDICDIHGSVGDCSITILNDATATCVVYFRTGGQDCSDTHALNHTHSQHNWKPHFQQSKIIFLNYNTWYVFE